MTSHKTRSNDKPSLPDVTATCQCGEEITAAFGALLDWRIKQHKKECGL